MSLLYRSSDVPILLGLRKTANASPYQNLDSCQPATILCNSSIYFFLLTCFLFGRFSSVVTAPKFLSFSQTRMLGCSQGLGYVRTCMRNELHGSCGFVRKNSLCLIVFVIFLCFQVFFSLFVFLFLYCLFPLLTRLSFRLVLLVLLLLVLVLLILFFLIILHISFTSFTSAAATTTTTSSSRCPYLLDLLNLLLFDVHFITFRSIMYWVVRPASVHNSSEIMSAVLRFIVLRYALMLQIR